jgi:hypothetical protein
MVSAFDLNKVDSPVAECEQPQRQAVPRLHRDAPQSRVLSVTTIQKERAKVGIPIRGAGLGNPAFFLA